MYQIKLSPYAKIFYTEWLLDPVSCRYNLVIDQTLYGNLDVLRLRNSLKRYVSDYVILNSHIQNIDGEPYWGANNSISELEYLDNPVSRSELLRYVTQSFDLYAGPLYRFRLIRIKKDVYRFIVVMHHLIMDGSSSLDSGVFDTISNYYNDENFAIKYSSSEQIKNMTELANVLATRVEQNKLQYKQFWREKLSDIDSIDLSFLQSNNKRKSKLSNSITEINFNFGAQVKANLEKIKLKYNVTPYLYSLNIFALLLHRYTGQEHLAISYPIAIKEGLDFIYGAQINTNLIPYQFSKTTTITELFNQSRDFFNLTIYSDVRFGYFPIEDIIQNINDKNLLNVYFAQTFFRERPFLFDEITNVKPHTELSIDGVSQGILLLEQDARNYKNQLNYRVRCDKRIADADLLNNFVVIYKKLFLEILEDLLVERNDKLLTDYNLLDSQQYKKLISGFNKTERDYPRGKTVQALFAEQVQKKPNHVAVIYANTSITYRELDDRANLLALYLRQLGVKDKDCVALCIPRSIDSIVAILGILKSGSTYVPLDSDYPQNRIQFILQDCMCHFCITSDELFNQCTKIVANCTDLKQISVVPMSEFYKRKDEINSENIISSKQDALSKAYVMYTSGTTGEPKGISISHRNIIRLVKNSNFVLFTPNDRIAHAASIAFDASTFEIWAPLLNGLTIVVVPHTALFDLESLSRVLKTQLVTIMWLTSELFNAIVSVNCSLLSDLRYLLIGGEKLNPTKVSQFFAKKKNKSTKLINGYGPTESTTFATTFTIPNTWSDNQEIPIGKPIANTTVYILDNNLSPLPIGAIGELFIGGDGVAIDYQNQLELTAQRFIPNPFQTLEERLQNKNGRIYRTGDFVRMLSDGNLAFIGRNDSQVKIRGYRIELREIENKLLKYPGITQTVVLAKKNICETSKYANDKYLIAYYVTNENLDEAKIQTYLASQLPEYMVPQILFQLKNLPLTVNGKLDKNALPEVKFASSYNYIAPKTKLHNKIIEIWSKVLNLPKELIGITDNFFKLGGNSISAIVLTTELSKIQECKNIKVVDVFKYSTIEQLAKLIEPSNSDTNITFTKIDARLEIEIAIIALSGAFSGCENTDQYWNIIQKGTEGIKNYTIDECRELYIDEKTLHDPDFVPAAGHVPNIDKFDASCWNLIPSEAKSLDPQIRKFLEHCWYVLEESGYFPVRDKMNIGVFAGSGNSSYLVDYQRQETNKPLNMRGLHYLSAKDILATKVSYILGLTGLSNNINTACSTSLVAVIEACSHLALGHCDMAIAGGASLLMPNEIGHLYQEGMIYAKEGHCRVFDSKSSGIIHGSGVGVVLLKRLTDAKKDKDNIIAFIKGYAVNNDGNRKISFTAPSIVGQKECIIAAQKMAGITSDAIDYVECHGTGTKLGDPIEISALGEAFASNADQKKLEYKCVIGSVKANIGHADVAAGIAGLIKICKMLEHKIMPKQINYDTPNPELYLNDTNFEIITETREWDKINNRLRVAAVSSFGIGGTNAHVIISEYIPGNKNVAKTGIEPPKKYVLPLSAKSKTSLEAYKNNFINYLTNTTDSIENIAYTLQLKREHFNYRIATASDSINEATARLKDIKNIAQILHRTAQHNVIFMFPGQNSQYANMSIELYQNDHDYKKIIDECIKLVNKYMQVEFEKILFPALFNNEMSKYDINQTEWSQPAIFIVEYALAKLLESLNIHADGYIGHSIGEYVAATLTGVFSLEDAIKLVIARGQLMQSMPKGAMLSIQASDIAVKQIVADNRCEIATVNSPQNCVASGAHTDIQNLNIELDKIAIPSIVLNVSHAFHSHFMADAARKFIYKLKQVKLNSPTINFISNVTGDFITATDAVNPEYWASHIRNPVLLSDGIKTLSEYHDDLFFIEVGTGKSLISFVKQCGVTNYACVQLLNSYKDYLERIPDLDCRESILSKLWINGYNVKFSDHVYDGCRVVKLPDYCFDSFSYWENQSSNIDVPAKNLKQASNESSLGIMDIKNKVVEQDQPEKYYDIAKIFLELLGIEKVSVHDDFFNLGGDSLLAISLATKLQHNYEINLTDIFRLRTISKIAESSIYAKDNLRRKLEQVKTTYKKSKTLIHDESNDKYQQYLQNVESSSKFSKKYKNIRNVLLTGATGHVGCNLLYQLLHETKYKIFLLVRADSDEQAINRINNKYKYYFSKTLNNYKDRVVILHSDIEKLDLGLSKTIYQELVNNIDSIIHCAALTKHYGSYDLFYKANVQTTINMLELSRQTKNKDFHYISTIAVLIYGYVQNCNYYTFTEDDNPDILLDRNNVYAKTKYEGEIVSQKYRKYGVAINIYRLGNVAMHSTSYLHQENITDNAFFSIAKTIQDLGITASEIDSVEISPVDQVASAIVKLFDQANLVNMVFHIFNPYLCQLSKLFIEQNIPMEMCTIDKFIDNLLMKLNTSNTINKEIELFMVHQLWLSENNELTQIKVLQDKTGAILKKLGFFWPKINKNMLKSILNKHQ